MLHHEGRAFLLASRAPRSRASVTASAKPINSVTAENQPQYKMVITDAAGPNADSDAVNGTTRPITLRPTRNITAAPRPPIKAETRPTRGLDNNR